MSALLNVCGSAANYILPCEVLLSKSKAIKRCLYPFCSDVELCNSVIDTLSETDSSWVEKILVDCSVLLYRYFI